MRALLLTTIAVASACDPPSPIGQKFRAKIKIATETGCPKFDGLRADRYERETVVAVEQNSIGFGRATIEPYDVVVGDPDDGVSSVSFTVGEIWKIGTTEFPVITAYAGTARYDELDLVGTVSFPQPNPTTAPCTMTTMIWGWDDGP